MGYRCTFITDDSYRSWTKRLKEKWSHAVNFPDTGPLSSKVEMKGWYSFFDDVSKDLSENMKPECGYEFPVYAACVWEDGRVDQVWITRKGWDYRTTSPEPAEIADYGTRP